MGIVVAGIALAAGIVTDDVCAVVIGMILVTTLSSPFVIKYVFSHKRPGPDVEPAGRPKDY